MPDQDCIFCKIVAGELPAFRVDETDRTLAFMDINPATPGHLLVIPKAHSRDVTDAEPDDLAAAFVTATRMVARVKDRLGADGANVLNACGSAAWQTVFHTHLHVIPRYRDSDKDPLQLPWIPREGDMARIEAIGKELAG